MVEAEVQPPGNNKKMRQMVEMVEEGNMVAEMKTVAPIHVILEGRG